MSAEILHEAAKVLRERTEKATQGPWIHIPAGAWTGRVFGGEDVVAKTSTDVPDEHGNAVYIATMDPDVGVGVADLLDEVAAHAQSNDEYDGLDPYSVITGYGHALHIARLILGGAS